MCSMMSLASVLAALLVHGSMGETSFRSSTFARNEKESPNGAEKAGEPFVVKLWRATARSSTAPGSPAAFYVGNVAVGSPPQQLTVLFDTASGHVILPSAACRNDTCTERRQYSIDTSDTAVHVDSNGRLEKAGRRTERIGIEFAQVDLGPGEVWGHLVRDQICVGASEACAEVDVLAATTMSEAPFRAMPHDGIIGLGLGGLLITQTCSFFGSLIKALPRSQFSIALRGQEGQISFGGINPVMPPAAPVKWFPVLRPEDGYWQVRILAVRVDNITVDACAGGCRGVIDTGASRLGTPVTVAPKLQALLTPSAVAGGGCQGPTLHLDLEGGSLMLRPADYAGPFCSESRVEAIEVGPEPEWLGVFVLGETVLRRYDTVYDWETLQVGFALSAPRAVRLGPPVAGLIPEQHHTNRQHARFFQDASKSTQFI